VAPTKYLRVYRIGNKLTVEDQEVVVNHDGQVIEQLKSAALNLEPQNQGHDEKLDYQNTHDLTPRIGACEYQNNNKHKSVKERQARSINRMPVFSYKRMCDISESLHPLSIDMFKILF
jgi:hypothetical protein